MQQKRTIPPFAVIALCALVVITEGYDLIVYGALLPALLKEPGWGLTSAAAGAIGSMVYVGMLFGALAGGRLADRFGRRRFTLTSVAWFAVWTGGCALADAPWELGLFRMLAGVGMGSVLPAIMALAKEYAPPGRTGLTMTVLMAGIPLGGTAASLLGLALLATHGWRLMFWIGAVISLLILVCAAALLPESKVFLQQRDPKRSWAAELLGPRLRTTTFLFAAATFMNLMTWYGINTWITTLMRSLNYPLSSALQFSLTLNTGAVIGSFAIAAAGDRWGTRRIAVLCALLAASGIAGCAVGTSHLPLLLTFIALIGMGGHSALNMINAAVADTYPAALRATALGWSNGVGRLGAVTAPTLGGWILGGIGPRAVFVAYMITALAAATLLTLLLRLGKTSEWLEAETEAA